LKFIHCSDIHLGTNRFGSDHLSGDFAVAFQRMADDAVSLDADAVIISGDFFNKPVVEPPVLLEAERALGMLKEAGIEVLAIEGNHDTTIYGDHISWIHFLSHRGLLKLLQTRYPDNKANIIPWTEELKKGAYHDIDGVRFYGLGYLGASSKKKLELLSEGIEPGDYTVGLLHAGVDMFNDMDMGGASKEDIELLRDKIDYMALGHVHYQYSIDEWIYNPGGLENWRIEECRRKKGYFVVDVKGNDKDVRFVESERRPCHIIDVDMSQLDGAKEIVRHIKSLVEERGISPNPQPIVSVKLNGKAKYDLTALDIEGVRKWIIDQTSAAECLVNDRTSFDMIGSAGMRHMDHRQVERETIAKLVGENDLGFKGLTPEQTVGLVLRYKEIALQGLNIPERHAQLKELISSTPTTRGD
jgi:DNA repair protein SbcD/Mre11